MKQTPNRPYDEPFLEADKDVTVPRPARHVPPPPSRTPREDDAPAPGATPGAEPGDDAHEGATERETGDRTGPGAGYDDEPERETDDGGVA